MATFGYSKTILISFLLTLGAYMPVLAEAPQHDRRPPLAEIWHQTSAEYRGLCYQAYAAAREQFEHWAPLLEKRSDGRAYLPGSDKPVAIILDLDETVLDNAGFQAFTVRTGTNYNPQIWNAWITFQSINKKAGGTVPGAVDFLAYVHDMGITPIFISNRDAGYKPQTIKVIEQNGIDTTDIENRVFLRLKGEAGDQQAREALEASGIDEESTHGHATVHGEGQKEGRRLMTRQNYDVLAYFGDVYGDFKPFVHMAEETQLKHFEQRKGSADENRDKWGKVWFILPNPMYGTWSIGDTIPKDGIKSSLTDYGFETYLRGRRVIK
jgi:predicted secreted acid phosphatase